MALVLGFILDLIFGDPQNGFHLVKVMGWMISKLEKLFFPASPQTKRAQLRGGAILVLLISIFWTAVPLLILFLAYNLSPWLGLAIESLLIYQLLAAKSLKTESLKVYRAQRKGKDDEARFALSMIVGRDVKSLDDEGISRAAVETIAENTNDAVIAPLLFISLGGAVGGSLYKAINTMDSMLGYKNERYIYFGKVAARLDDVVNYFPARLAALFMILASFLAGHGYKNAWRIWRRDKRLHASPNSAQTEAVMAGALGVRLAGDAVYKGVLHKKDNIGDELRKIEAEDIVRANKIMYLTSLLCFAFALLLRLLIIGVFFHEQLKPWW